VANVKVADMFPTPPVNVGRGEVRGFLEIEIEIKIEINYNNTRLHA